MGGKRIWVAVVGISLCLAILGIAITLSIVQNEGWEGLWKRKRGFLESTHPESGPVIDQAEKRARDVTPTQRP